MAYVLIHARCVCVLALQYTVPTSNHRLLLHKLKECAVACLVTDPALRTHIRTTIWLKRAHVSSDATEAGKGALDPLHR